ncbi:hypothetical protein OUZ56_018501 [Daphnia magna]|uniref:Uncharacterized protein n=1 Tax=Daphnia magna TaxID=35525 RepID=A0ABQ9Z9L6_9CRUS|nr:hypothetical protein OUZ56_018499 [Daphnia magna]KAK4009386.1 hypothetical protein OUZ56_018501 [Daphnia magna]
MVGESQMNTLQALCSTISAELIRSLIEKIAEAYRHSLNKYSSSQSSIRKLLDERYHGFLD